MEQTVKFSTVVGISLVEIDRKTLRLGAVSSSRAILRDQCVITNKSQGLDARFELVPSSKRVRISKSREVLKPGASVTIYVTLSCETVGLCIEFIELKNIDIPTETTRVEIGAFVDPQEVSFASLTANNQSGIDLLENLRVYVVPSEDNEDQYNVVHSEVREVRNTLHPRPHFFTIQPQKLISCRRQHHDDNEHLIAFSHRSAFVLIVPADQSAVGRWKDAR